MTDSQLKALRAAGRVTLTLSLFGCIEEAPTVTSESTETEADAESDAESDAAPPDSDLFVDALTRDGAPHTPAADAGLEWADGGATGDGGLACDATRPDWAACCEAQNWNPAVGCLAWGPPVPPALA